jgi:hypothetical protein
MCLSDRMLYSLSVDLFGANVMNGTHLRGEDKTDLSKLVEPF